MGGLECVCGGGRVGGRVKGHLRILAKFHDVHKFPRVRTTMNSHALIDPQVDRRSEQMVVHSEFGSRSLGASRGTS